MKILLVCLLLAGGAFAKNDLSQFKKSDRELTAKFNDYVDRAIPSIVKFLIENGLDPLNLPDIVAQFSVKPIFITYHGLLELNQGILYNVRSLHRAGDIIIKYTGDKLQLTGSIGIRDIEFEYKYSAKLMNIGPSGGVKGSLNKANIYFDISIDFETLSLSLNRFNINDVGSIRVRLTGNVVIDWLLNILIRIVTAIFKDNLIGFLENKIMDVVQDFINDINYNIGLSKFLLDMKLHGTYDLIHIVKRKSTINRTIVPTPTLYLDMTHIK